MHECPDCGQACDCDGEDIWSDWAGRTCRHTCDDDDDGDRYLDCRAWSCECRECPECGEMPKDCSNTECSQTCSCSECKYCAVGTVGRFELRIEDGRRFWWGAEDGWKDATEIGENGVLMLDAAAFAIGTILTLSEPVSDDTMSHDEAENDELRQACEMLAEAADNGEWHNSEDCRDEGCTNRCHLCQALIKAHLILDQNAE